MNEYYFHSRGENRKDSRVTFYGRVNNDGYIEVSVARCSDADQFCRATGREIAKRRMQENGPQFTIKSNMRNDFVDFARAKTHLYTESPNVLPSISRDQVLS